MRAGLSTIQQTLTPEAASVLNHSIAEAGRRNHGQTTPLHVAATLLASPSGFLRQACVRSHPNSSHPLQCRALELCFSVALDRIPSAPPGGGGGGAGEPSISNALMAALKRAQAHQRRGCPEQQQQPLLAVKVELEQLVVSILDDPSVSRVMREASFSSPAVKATIEQSLNSSSAAGVRLCSPTQTPTPPPPARNLYLNPRLQRQQQGSGVGGAGDRREEVKRIVEILMRNKKRNPVLVGESEPASVAKELLLRFEKREFGDGPLRDVRVVSIERDLLLGSSDRERIPSKLRELGGLIESRIDGGGVVVDLGDLKWLVEPAGAATEAGRAAVLEMGKVLERFGQRVWLVGTATCETYLRCQVYHPTMENDWDLQVVPIAARSSSSVPGLFPRGTGILSSSVESLSPLKSFPPTTTTGLMSALAPRHPLSENTDPSRRNVNGRLCPLCAENYERELAKLVAEELEKSSNEAKQQQPLPQWLQLAKKPSDSIQTKQRTEELQKRYRETCLRLHPNFHSSALNPSLLQPLQPKLPLQMNRTLAPAPNRPASPPGSPVHTDLVLGIPKTHEDRVKDSGDRPVVDADSFKRLFKRLLEKVPWQAEAASAIATTIAQCKSGQGRRRKGDAWLLLIGPDRVGKAKMAAALSELLCGCAPVTIRLGFNDAVVEENNRGKTAVDRVADAVRRNPFSVVVVEDVDRADALFQGSIRRAVEKGRLADSHGREVSLGGVTFVLTTDWTPDDLKSSSASNALSEERLASAVRRGWDLKLLVRDERPHNPKRRPDWLFDGPRATKPRKESGLSLDLNLAAGGGDDEGSRNSSDLTVEHEQVCGPSFSARGLMESVPDTIVFRPVDFGPIRTRVVEAVTGRFGSVVGNGRSLEIDEVVVHRIVGGAWFGRTGAFEEWMERVLVPGFHALNRNLTVEGGVVLRLVASDDESDTERRMDGVDFLPRKITVAVDSN
ncbi:Chaperone protein ClpB1 [Acorus gramineus]|uniref:Chaperone protein ClpB1 n=1 Tax=Acorus gramineus TaxID=55184 RepID=A0AAV9BFY6_ACOGR|nr:Chaperone protein ClpB1 [Acorus gramineus]